MAFNSMSSKEKVAFIVSATELITATFTKIKGAMDTTESIAQSSNYAAMNRVYNSLATLTNILGEVFTEDKKILAEVATTLTKRTDVGETFVASAKKALADVEAIPAMPEYSPKSTDGDGSEGWNGSKAAELNSAVDVWNSSKRDFILELGDAFRKIQEEEFRQSLLPLCKKNETFTNALADSIKSLNDNLDELEGVVAKLTAETADAASSFKAEEVNLKPNLMGVSI